MSIGAPENDHQEAKAVSRRTLVKGAAWAVPVIAFAAPVPAMAASVCTPSTNFDGLAVGTSPSTITFYNSLNQPTGVTATLAWTANGQPSSKPGNTGQVLQTTQNPIFNFIEIQMVQSLNQGDYVELTLTIVGGPVKGLSFKLIDIDKTVGPGNIGWVDTVWIRTVGYTYATGPNVQGSGTQADPFNPKVWGDKPIVSGEGDVRITYPGAISQVVIRYLAGDTGNAQSQHIGLGNLSYDICQTAPAAKSTQRSAIAPQSQLPAPLAAGGSDFVGDGSVDQ